MLHRGAGTVLKLTFEKIRKTLQLTVGHCSLLQGVDCETPNSINIHLNMRAKLACFCVIKLAGILNILVIMQKFEGWKKFVCLFLFCCCCKYFDFFHKVFANA